MTTDPNTPPPNEADPAVSETPRSRPAWALDPLKGSEKPLAGKCGARLRRHAEMGVVRYCKNRPVPTATRCRFHGGKTPRGISNVQTNLRRYRGADMPAQLASRFVKALDDPEALSLRQEMALVDTRIVQLIEKLPTNESAAAWASIATTLGAADRDLDALLVATDADERTQCGTIVHDRLTALRAALTLAASERSLWGEIVEHVEVRRRLADTDRRREETLGIALTLRQGMTLIGALLTAIGEEVTDASVKMRLAQRINVLLVASGAVESSPALPTPDVT